MPHEQRATNVTWHEGSVTRHERQEHLNQKGVIVWMTGLSASGKSTIARILEKMLLHREKLASRLDGDNIRHRRHFTFCPPYDRQIFRRRRSMSVLTR